MTREFTCIVCPNGCEIQTEIEDGAIVSITGFQCPKGKTYVEQEVMAPKRTIASSILVEGGVLPLASVRLTDPIPKERIFDAMREIKKVKVQAPVSAGTIVIKNLLGFESDVVVTKNVPKKQQV